MARAVAETQSRRCEIADTAVTASGSGPRAAGIAVRLDRKAMACAVAAAAIEGYDLSIYAIFAISIAQAFFPASDSTSSLLMTVGTFGIGFFIRPLGGILLGLYADRVGRRAAIALTVLLITASTAAIGLIPRYDSIGAWAPVLVILARMVQGIGAGGAMGGSISYLLEAAPANRRGYVSSFQQASQVSALLLAVLIGVAVNSAFSPEEVARWAWRLPFLLALLLLPISVLVKRMMPDPATFLAARAATADSAPPLVARLRGPVVAGFGISCLWSTSTVILLYYMPTYAQRDIGLSAATAYGASAAAAALLGLSCLPIGLLSDRLGKRPVMLAAAGTLLVGAYPAFALLVAAKSAAALYGVQCLLALVIAGYTAPVSAMLGGLFPTRNRATALSISYNLSTLTFAAFGPLLVTWAIAAFADPLWIAYYVMFAAAISVVTLILVKDRSAE